MLRTPPPDFRFAGQEEKNLRAPSRRLALGSMFTAGFALATGPARAEAIVTDDIGLIIEEPAIRAAGGYRLPLYVARPQTAGRHPTILVANEAFGIHAYLKDVCRRLAKLGYVAVAPDYFDRAGDPSTMTEMADIFRVMSQTPYTQWIEDTDCVLRWMTHRSYVHDDKIGMTGFCWGGGATWMAAERFPCLKAGVAWYGVLTAPPAGSPLGNEQRPWPIDGAANLKCPVLGLYADHDDFIPESAINTMRAALAANGNSTHSEIIVYPNTQHGFHADYRPTYNQTAAQDGWSRMLAWFRVNGVA